MKRSEALREAERYHAIPSGAMTAPERRHVCFSSGIHLFAPILRES
jgi:hypothetical protein